MKMILAVAALATMIASPVLAQSSARRALALGNAAPVADSLGRLRLATNPAYDVYEGGQYIGSDPDPNVRLALRRDYNSHD